MNLDPVEEGGVSRTPLDPPLIIPMIYKTYI